MNEKKFEIVEVVSDNQPYAFMKTQEVLGTMAIVLPYKKKLSHVDYLLCRESIPCWDDHPDVCGIAVYGDQDKVEELIIAKLLKTAGYAIDPIYLKYLGVCAGDRRTNTTCHLYAVDVTHQKLADEFIDESKAALFWGSAENVLESLDTQLISAYAKLQYLFF